MYSIGQVADASHAPAMQPLITRLSSALQMSVVNGVGEGELNAGCGAEFVQKGRLAPRSLDTPPTPEGPHDTAALP